MVLYGKHKTVSFNPCLIPISRMVRTGFTLCLIFPACSIVRPVNVLVLINLQGVLKENVLHKLPTQVQESRIMFLSSSVDNGNRLGLTHA